MSVKNSKKEGKAGSLSRRGFIRYGALGSAVSALHAATPRASSRFFTGPVGASAGGNSLDPSELTIHDLQEGMKSGSFSSSELTEAYIRRIQSMDQQGPALHHVLEINPDAMEIAEALDRERKEKGSRGPLHGIPVLVKDNIATQDRMNTTAGSLALLGSKPPRDSFVARRLREAGAVLLGKTNLSEWANFRSNHSSSGWSGRGGQGRNPYALDRSPCGSSSGSGAAVAASYCAVAIGTETDGSIVCPSNANSIVGIKPTVGLVSRSGVIPISHSQDSAGPMARTVADAAILLGALVGVDARDQATQKSQGKFHRDYTPFLDPDGLRGARIGVARKHFFGYSDRTDKLIENAIDEMKRRGALIVDPADIPHVGDYDDSEMQVLLYEFKADLNGYLAELGPEAPVHTLAEIIHYNQRNRDREMLYFGQEVMERAQEKGPLTEASYLQALEKNHRLSRAEGIDQVLKEHNLDALIAPTGAPPWTIDLVNGDHFGGGSSTPAAVAGYPSISVPAGYIFGLPVGISFIGTAFSEPTLIKLAYAFERVTQLRRPPRYLKTADLDEM